LLELQFLIMAQPSAAPIIAGTGGLRKLRFGLQHRSLGKRGGIRVCYVYYERFNVVLLVHAYAKSRKDDLTNKEKAAIRSVIIRIESHLAARSLEER
jgi:hypothetical protein